MTRIIVAIDGNVNTGKTSLLKNIMKRYPEFCAADEYEIINEENPFKRQFLYMIQDESRIGNSENNTILDRSIISLSAYAFWLFKIQNIDIRSEFHSAYINSLAKGKNKVPNRVIICSQKYDAIVSSYETNRLIKGTAPVYVEREYIDIQEEFLATFQEELKDKIIEYNYSNTVNKIDLYDEKYEIGKVDFLHALQKALRIDNINCNFSIDGMSAVGKSSLCKIYSLYGFYIADEIRKVNCSTDEESFLKHQIEYFIESVQRYKSKKRIVIDNGIFENIAYSFYSAAKKNYGMSFIDSYIKKIKEVSQDIRINQIFFLYMEREKIEQRKSSDISKTRQHFKSNIELWSGEIKLSRLLTQLLPNQMFVIINADKSIEEVFADCYGRMHYLQMELLELINVIEKNKKIIYQFFSDYGGGI